MDEHLQNYPAAIRRWMYGESFNCFLRKDSARILGELLKRSEGSVELLQRNAWEAQICILKKISVPRDFADDARIYLEYTVPRLGRRADVVLLIGHVLFVLEFKVGESNISVYALDQVWDYALDFKNFHDASHQIPIIPVLIATEISKQDYILNTTTHDDGLLRPICVASDQISDVIFDGLSYFQGQYIDAAAWECGRYLPTPTIVEAARALYAGHHVGDISRSDAGAKNLTETAYAVDRIIEQTRNSRRKAICFVTGVPGAGKTLVGLDIANRNLEPDSATYSVFLSGNGPLVAVLREALTRDRVERASQIGCSIRKGDAKKEVETFIQNVHHFRDEYVRDTSPPPEHVVLFDEAQRAWDIAQTSAFMKRKKGILGFNQSEPEFLIRCLDRHRDWSVIVCLVGSGQEINTGEGGIGEWFDAILRKYASWDVYMSPNLADSEYQGGDLFKSILARPNTFQNDNLHLATSIRSFRAESLSRFIKEVLNLTLVQNRFSSEVVH